RPLSNGREARAGSALRCDNARMAPNPLTPTALVAASLPPAIITSASPRWMRRNESPTACALVVQAVQVAEFGPLAPVRIEIQPEARFTMAPGMKNGLTRR